MNTSIRNTPDTIKKFSQNIKRNTVETLRSFLLHVAKPLKYANGIHLQDMTIFVLG